MDKLKGIYVPHVSLMYSSHLTQDLSANTIQGVVRNILEHTLTMGVENISLPSRATAQRMVAEAGELARIMASYELALKKGTIRHHSDKKTKSQQIHWGTHILKIVVNVEHKAFHLAVNPGPPGKVFATVEQLEEEMNELQEN